MSYENFVRVKVVTPVTAVATSFAIVDAVAPNKLPPLTGGFLVLCDSPGNPSFIEVIKYGYRTGLGLYDVLRGQEGTAAVAWSGNVYAFQALMAGETQLIQDTLAGKEPAIVAGLSTDYRRGDKTWRNFMADVRATVLTGYLSGSNAVLAATDTLLAAFGKIQGQLDAKAPLASPALTGIPTAPTAALGTNTAQLATMAAIQAAIANLVNGAPGALDALNELAAAMGNDPNFATTMTNALAGKEPTITQLPINKGGTGAITAAEALTALGLNALGIGAPTAVTNPDDVTLKSGIYQAASTGGGTYPAGFTNGSLIVTCRNVSPYRCNQILNSDADGKVWTRAYNGSWTAWIAVVRTGDFGLGATGSGPSVSDANTATTTGFYTLRTPFTNGPTAGAYTLMVQTYDGEVTQFATGEGSTAFSVWVRKRIASGSTWGSWDRMLFRGDYGFADTCAQIAAGACTDVRDNGLYSVTGAVSGLPVAGTTGTMEVRFSAGDTAYGTLIFTTYTGRTFTKSKNAGAWGGWKELLVDGQGQLAGGGLLEVGRYIDFHSDGTAVDFSARIQADSNAQLGIDVTSLVTRGNTVMLGAADADTAYLFRSGRLDCVNYANSGWKTARFRASTHNFENTSGATTASVDTLGNLWASGAVTAAFGNVVSSSLFICSATQGKLGLTTGNLFNLHWNNGFYYNIDNNGWTLINAAASDASLKDINHRTTAEEAGDLVDQLAAKSVNYTFKTNAPIVLPTGERYGFIAQETAPILPGLFKETGVAGANEDCTIQTFTEDAAHQMISLLMKTVSDLRSRVAALEAQ